MQKAGLSTRVLELLNVSRDKESSINELSKPVSTLMPYYIDLVTNSNDNDILVLGKRDDKNLWLYRYFNNDRDRVQSAWFRWEMSSYSLYNVVMDDVLYTVGWETSDSPGVGEIVSLMMVDLKDELATALCR